MWTVSEMICFIILTIISIWDVKVRMVPLYMIIFGMIGSVLHHCICRDMDIWVLAGGIVVGAAFLGVSKLTEEGIGYGDSWVILNLGIYLGLWNLLMVLAIAFFLLLCVTLPMLWRKKMSRKYTLPFLPFLETGYLCLILMGGVNG